MINLEKFNIKIDKRLLAQLFFYSSIVISFIGFLMFINGFNRSSISGVRKSSGRIEFEFYDNYLYMFSHNSQTYAPVTDIRYYKSDSKEDPDNPLIVFFTTKNEYRFYAKKNDIDEEDLKELYNELNAFMEDEKTTEFGESFFYLRFYGFFGIILAGLVGYYIIPLYKKIPPPLPKTNKEPKIKGKDKETKKQKKIKKVKKVITAEMLLKIILPVYDTNFKFNPKTYDTPYTHGVVIACTSVQKIEFSNKYDDEYEYIICDKNTSTAEMVIKAEQWLKDFTGYIIVQTSNIPNLTSTIIENFYKAHKSAQNECTILTTETYDPQIPFGKIMRNMANRIVTISEVNESNDTSIQAGQVSLGLFCFNSKKIFENLKGLNNGGDLTNISLEKIIDKYYKNRSKMNTFITKTSAKQVVKSNVAGVEENIVLPSKKTKAIILSTLDYNPAKLKKSYEALSPEIEDIYVIINPQYLLEAKELLGENVELIASEGKLGDADDVLKTNDILRDFNGLVIVITEDIIDVSKDNIGKLLTEHTNQNNICSYVKLEDKNVLYCTDAFQFLYAVKMISRNAITRKYHLSGLLDILIDAKKRVGEVVL